MSNFINLGGKEVGDGQPCYIVAEIGINHNGSLEIAKKLISEAAIAGCDAVKFQKRTVDIVYSQSELETPRESVFGKTNGDLKRGLEFGSTDYKEIDRYCKRVGISWFASCWDENSVDFIEQFNPICYKIASACLTESQLLKYHIQKGRPIILSTGMSDLPMIERAVDILGQSDLIILHCTSTYPSKLKELNLRAIQTLIDHFPSIPIGYSGHEVGLATSLAAVVSGACVVERHITLDRSTWGTDQSASVEPQGLAKLVRDIRGIEEALGNGEIKIYESEVPIIEKLRKINQKK